MENRKILTWAIIFMSVFFLSFTSAAVTTTLNSPADGSTQYTNPVTLNASGSASSGYLANATLYDNSTGSWGARNSSNTYYVTTADSGKTAGTVVGSGSFKAGIRITPKQDLIVYGATKVASSGATNCYIRNASNTVNLATGTYSSNYCAFTTNITLTANQIYYIIDDKGGSSYDVFRFTSSANVSTTYLNFSGGYYNNIPDATTHSITALNIAVSPTTISQTFTNTYSSGSNIKWNVKYCDLSNVCSFATSNRTFKMDSVGPTISVTSPASLVNYGKLGGNLTLNFSATDTNLASCWYNYNFTNRSCGGESELSYQTGQDNYYTINSANAWRGQSFTSTSPASITSVSFKLFKEGNPGVAQVSIYATDVSGYPTGAILGYGLFNANELTTDTDGGWVDISLTSPLLISPGTYAIIMNASSSDVSNRVLMLMDRSSASYEGGWGQATDNAGASWLTSGETNQWDTLFRLSPSEWGGASNLTLTSQKNLTIYANDTLGNINSQFVSWDYKIFENSNTFNSTTYETAYETYSINVTANSSLTAINLIFNGSSYPLTSQGGGTWSYSRDLPSSVVGTQNFYYAFTYGGGTISSGISTQTVSEIFFGACNATYSNDFLNLTFKDETSLVNINAAIQSSTWEYYLGTGTETKEYIFYNNTENPSYEFCASPTDRTYYVSVQANYLASTYPTRIWQTLAILTNTVTEHVLYLLSQDDGIYTTFITATEGNTPIDGVSLIATRSIGGEDIVVAQGTSDSAGSVTFWLNPNYDHLITASKTGYGTGTATIRPTQSTYTITLSSAIGNYTYVNDYDGLKWYVFPGVGIRNQSVVNNYGFNITAENDNILKCKIELTDSSKTILLSSAETIATDAGQCFVQTSYTINSTYPKIKGRLLIDVGEGYQLLEDDAYWALLETNSTGLTITDWFNSLTEFDLSYFNNNEQHREYTQILIFFLVAMIICAGMNSFGWDIQTNGGMIYLMGGLIVLASIPGFLTLNYISPYTWVDQYFVAVVYTFFMVGFGLRSMQ